MELTVQQTKNMFIHVGQQVIAKRDELTKIDQAIGDGDHGVGMERGFKHAIEKLQSTNYESINDIFTDIGKEMLAAMGGASGVLFGSLFIGAVKGQAVMTTLTAHNVGVLFEKGLQAVQQRGKAQLGDKTMVDALYPAVQALLIKEENRQLIKLLQNASLEANNGVEKTKQQIANFGRAKSLGERTIGYQDAGATTIAIVFEAMYEFTAQQLENAT